MYYHLYGVNLRLLGSLLMRTVKSSLGTQENSFVPHYENTPLQYTVIFQSYENDNFQMKNL